MNTTADIKLPPNPMSRFLLVVMLRSLDLFITRKDDSCRNFSPSIALKPPAFSTTFGRKLFQLLISKVLTPRSTIQYP